ncbi:putative calcium-binding protein 8 [Triplophysa rosa]|uniref:Calcium-binding protein 8 n=1 Tax=Triplophysa rosa TaxID=992332 RepID=A0A9W7TK78_TRIRA|nr:putative calcium-binding protein 8 [Triplophysa rosa]
MEVADLDPDPLREGSDGMLVPGGGGEERVVLQYPGEYDQYGEKMPFHHVTAGLLYKGNYLSRSLSDHSNSEQLANISVEELDEIRETFRVLDRDGNGFISKQELGMAMRSLGHMPSEVELAIIMQRLDMDGDGQVDFDEFMTILGPKLLSSETREGFLGNTIDSIFWQSHIGIQLKKEEPSLCSLLFSSQHSDEDGTVCVVWLSVRLQKSCRSRDMRD